MKYTISIVVVILGLQCGGWVHAELVNADGWSRFLQEPTRDNLDKLIGQISRHVDKCDWGAAENQVAVPSEIRYRLFDNIASGDEASLRAGFYVERCFDGGDLEDFYESGGQFFDKKPEAFLQETKRSSASMASYASMLINLPEALVDNLDGQIKAVSRRIRLLDEIDADGFEELKKVGIGALKER